MRKCQKRPIIWQKRPIIWQKRPIIWQKRSINISIPEVRSSSSRGMANFSSGSLSSITAFGSTKAPVGVLGTQVCGHLCTRNTCMRTCVYPEHTYTYADMCVPGTHVCVYPEHMYVCIRNTRTCMRPCVYQEHMYADMCVSDTRIKYRLDGIYLCIWHASDASVSDA